MLGKMISFASPSNIVVPKIYYYDEQEKLWFAGGKMNWKTVNGEHIGDGEVDRGQYDEIKKISYAPTCCMLLHKSVFEQIGLEDENYFMYFDDTDLCARIIENNFNIIYIPAAYLWHKVSSSTGSSISKLATYYHNRNKLYFMNKFKIKINLLDRVKVYIYGICKFIFSCFYKKYNRVIISSYKDYIRGCMGRRK